MRVAYLNWWMLTGSFQDLYLPSYINEMITDITIVSPGENPDLLICSLFGPLQNVINCKAKKKIFFTGENLNRRFDTRFSDYKNRELMQKTFDLIIGYEPTNLDKKTIRFPLWITYYGYEAKKIIDYLESSYKKNKINKTIFGSLVSSHDDHLGYRRSIYNELSKYGQVICPGPLLRNININNGNFDKIQVISNTIYNVCPENSKGEGYCTEKIFQALEGGCIPLYWGDSNPEPELLNENKYCFCPCDNQEKLSETIKNALENKESFLNGPIFKPNAEEILNKYFSDLKEQLELLLLN